MPNYENKKEMPPHNIYLKTSQIEIRGFDMNKINEEIA